MLRVLWATSLNKRAGGRGFLTLEVMLASVIFGFLSVAIVGALIYGRQSTAGAGNYDRASVLADEGLEAIRNIRDAAYSNLPSSAGTYYLSQSGGVWSLVPSPAEPTIDGMFTRDVVIANVDANRKTVTVRVNWTTGSVSRQATAVARLTNWMATITPPAPTNGPIIMAYSKTTTTPFYRTWDGSNWSAEGSASAVTGNINYIVVKSSRTRNEAILGVQTSTGAIFVQIWNGTSWSSATQVGTGPTTTRSFDIAYEKNGDRAIIVHSAGADFAYRIWDGSTLPVTSTTVTTPPTTGTVNWIELDQNPLSASNEIAMIMLDSNADVYGMRWTGSAWNNFSTATVWDTTASIATRKGIDVEYEQTSGEILFAWGDGTSPNNNYRTWNGTTLSGVNPFGILAITAQGGASQWLQLASRPSSNEIMLGVQDAGADLNTRLWSGSGWDATAHPKHDDAVENIQSRNFDIVWETHTSNPGKAWIMWGDANTLSVNQWSGSAWTGASFLAVSDDTSFVRLRADPVSGAVFAGIYHNSGAAAGARDINERRLTGGSATWSAKNTIWTGNTSADPVHFRIDITMP